MSELLRKPRQIPPGFIRQARNVAVSDNEQTMLSLIRNNAGISRADLTRITGLTAQSVSRIVDGLHERNFVDIGKPVPNGRGQPSAPLRLNPDAAYSIGFSIMTDAVSAALMNFAGDIVEEQSMGFSRPSLDHVLSIVCAMADDMTERHVRDRKTLFGAGVGITGYLTGKGRQVNPPGDLDELAFIDLEEIISDRLGLPVWVDNDGTAAAIGECLAGAGRRHKNFAFIYIAFGLGGALVANGNVWRGEHGNAGEFSSVLPLDIRPDRPTLELLRRVLNEHGASFNDFNELIETFDIGWPGVEAWLDRVTPTFHMITEAICAVFDPGAVVIGGRIPKPLAERLAQKNYFEEKSRRGVPRPRPKLVVSEVRGDATAIGAASTPLKIHFFK